MVNGQITTQRLNLYGKVIIPIGYARWYVDNGYMTFNVNKVDKSLTSLYVSDYMLKSSYAINDVLIYDNGEVKIQQNFPVNSNIRVVIDDGNSEKLVGLLGPNVPPVQQLHTVAKLTYKSGFSVREDI